MSNLSFGSGESGCSSSKAHLPHVSLLSQPGTGPGIRPVIQHHPPGAAAMPCWFPVAFRPPAFASWASCSRQGTGPPSRSAYRRASAHHRSPPDPDGVSTFHTRKTRLGLGALCIPGITVSTRSSMCPRPPPAASQRQRPCPPSTTTRPGRFESRDISEGFRTSPHASLPLTRCPWTVQGPLGFPVSSAPSRCRPRTSRWGRVLDTDPKSRRRHQSTSNRRTHLQRATSCRSTGFKHCSAPSLTATKA